MKISKNGSGDSTWDNLKQGYLRQVEKSLMKVSSPRKKEVLEDVACHLDQKYRELADDDRTWENYQQIITEMGPAEDYAELLSPTSVEASTKKFPLGKILTIVVIAGLLLLLPFVFKTNAKIEIGTTKDFLPGDLIEITEILGTTDKIEPGQTYTIRGKYKLGSQDKAKLHLYATNGETTCSQGPTVNKGQGEFTRTFTYQKEGWLHLSYYPAKGGSSFGNLYFNNKGGYLPNIQKIMGVTSKIGTASAKTSVRSRTMTAAQKMAKAAQDAALAKALARAAVSKVQEAANTMGVLDGMLYKAHDKLQGDDDIKPVLAVMEVALPRFEKFTGLLEDTDLGEAADIVKVQLQEAVSAMKNGDLDKSKIFMDSAYASWGGLYQSMSRKTAKSKLSTSPSMPAKRTKTSAKPSFPIEIDTTTRFLPGDSIEITEILGTTGKIEAGQTYTVKGKYKLSSRDEAQIHLLSTNGVTSSPHGPTIKRGSGEFTRTLKYIERNKGARLQAIFCPVDGGESFGDLYFYNKKSHVPEQ